VCTTITCSEAVFYAVLLMIPQPKAVLRSYPKPTPSLIKSHGEATPTC